jgi:hypothetical protein
MTQLSAGKPLASPAGSRARARKSLFTSERGLGLAGLALAIASGSFAAYMIADKGRQPYFSGAEYLTVFAKLTPSGGRGSPGWKPSDGDLSEPDDFATGSIARKLPSGTGANGGAGDGLAAPAASRADRDAFAPGLTVRDYVLRSVVKGVALVDGPDGLRDIRLGTVLPYAGLVTAIEQRDGRWVVITSRGIIREARR